MRVRFGRCVFDSQARELTRDGKPLPLSPKAFTLLEAPIAASPSALSKEELYDKVWPDTFVEPGNLHNLVAEIRSTLDRHAIRTVHRFGYAFDGIVTPDEPQRFEIVLAGEEIPLREGENIIGRDPAAAAAIDAPDVSRHHARLVVEGGNVTLEDLGSKNGMLSGETRLAGAMPLRAGDEFWIGRTRLRLRALRTLPTTITST